MSIPTPTPAVTERSAAAPADGRPALLDMLVTPEAASSDARSGLELDVQPDAGHFVHMERPDEAADAIGRFFPR